jgi:hypothetical protein
VYIDAGDIGELVTARWRLPSSWVDSSASCSASRITEDRVAKVEAVADAERISRFDGAQDRLVAENTIA